MSQQLQKAHKSFRKDNIIVVTKVDKGNDVVEIDRTDHMSKTDDVLGAVHK